MVKLHPWRILHSLIHHLGEPLHQIQVSRIYQPISPISNLNSQSSKVLPKNHPASSSISAPEAPNPRPSAACRPGRPPSVLRASAAAPWSAAGGPCGPRRRGRHLAILRAKKVDFDVSTDNHLGVGFLATNWDVLMILQKDVRTCLMWLRKTEGQQQSLGFD